MVPWLRRAAILNVSVAPADTLRWHLLALPLALGILLLAQRMPVNASRAGEVVN